MTAKFEDIENRMQDDFGKINARFDEVDNRLYNLEKSVSEHKKVFVQRFELDDLADRVAHLEKKVSTRSRK